MDYTKNIKVALLEFVINPAVPTAEIIAKIDEKMGEITEWEIRVLTWNVGVRRKSDFRTHLGNDD